MTPDESARAMSELDENVLQAVARMAYEQATGHDWHTAASDPGLDPHWRAEVMRCAVYTIDELKAHNKPDGE
jgi:hypothetical protein